MVGEIKSDTVIDLGKGSSLPFLTYKVEQLYKLQRKQSRQTDKCRPAWNTMYQVYDQRTLISQVIPCFLRQVKDRHQRFADRYL